MPKRKAVAPLIVDFSKLTVALLKSECDKRKLDKTGRKADLVQRLDDFENNLSKNVKKEEPEQEEASELEEKELTMKDKLIALAEKEKRNKVKKLKVDSFCELCDVEVVQDYDCMLNQTNIGANNNKFYVIQLLSDGYTYHVWTRWGRVGESGANALKGPMYDLSAAEKEFKKKFKDKTKNDWDERANFTPKPQKYTMIEMDAQDSQDIDEIEEKLSGMDSVDGPSASVKQCTLSKPTQSLIKLLFDQDMFKEAMQELNLDVKKMPLGKLSKSQIAKGFEVLEEVEASLKSNKGKLQEIVSRFYTLIPHNFGRNRPPLISDMETVQNKMDMLAILGDIVIAQTLQKEIKAEKEQKHQLDINYGLLNCGLTHVDQKSDTFKMINEYVEKTKSSWNHASNLLDVWEVDRNDEDKRFAEHKDVANRKLLWHGTNIAVVVAILKSGLRIMPHSGGRVGRGIYFASEHQKSAAYVSGAHGFSIMFLNEVALGEQHIIHRDDPSLRKAPAGYDSVLAQGQQEPDPKKDITIKIDGNDVIVPQGKPINVAESRNSSFSNSEYLVYKESQCRIRYLLKFQS